MANLIAGILYPYLYILPFLYLLYHPFRDNLRLSVRPICIVVVLLASAGLPNIIAHRTNQFFWDNLYLLQMGLYGLELFYFFTVVRFKILFKLFCILLTMIYSRFTYLIAHIFSTLFPDYPHFVLLDLGCIVVLCLTFPPIYQWFNHHEHHMKLVDYPKLWQVSCVILIVSYLNFLIPPMALARPWFQEWPLFTLLLCMPAVGSVCLLLYCFTSIENKKRLQSTLLTMEKMRLAERQYYHLISQTFQASKQLLQSMYIHNNQLYQHAVNRQGRQIEEYLDKFSFLENSSKQIVFSGNKLIDALSSYWLIHAQMRGIRTDYKIQALATHIADMDLTILLGNALENAVDAATEADSENRWLKFSIQSRYDKLIITLDNGFNGQLIQRDGQYFSHKRNFLRKGIGLSSIANIVKKYAGTMKIETEDKTFRLSIIVQDKEVG